MIKYESVSENESYLNRYRVIYQKKIKINEIATNFNSNLIKYDSVYDKLMSAMSNLSKKLKLISWKIQNKKIWLDSIKIKHILHCLY